MLKKEITYKDLDENDVTETFWFHFSKGEMAKMALEKEGKDGGFEQWIRTMTEAQDGATLTATFEKILLSSVGERSADNKRFIKTDEVRDNFRFSDAFSVLFMELLTDTDKMLEFINGIMPKDMRDEVAKETRGVTTTPDISSVPTPKPVEEGKDDTPAWVTEGRTPTAEELKGATPEQIALAFQRRGKQ